MKLEGLKTPVRREHAASALGMTENNEVMNFDVEREFGSEFKLRLLTKAEERFAEGIRDPSFYDGLHFLATHFVLFPNDRHEVNAILEKYKIKDYFLETNQFIPAHIFIDARVLLPELRPKFAQRASLMWDAQFPSVLWVNNKELWGTFGRALNFISLDPKYLAKILEHVTTEKLFFEFDESLKHRNWWVVVRHGAALKMCFPNEFKVPQFSPDQWKELIKQIKSYDPGTRPEIFFDLAVLLAEEVDLLGDGPFKLIPKKPGLKTAQPLPERSLT